MFKKVLYVLVIITIFSCQKNDDIVISENVTLFPDYSLPLGNITFDLNNRITFYRGSELEYPDSILFNDTIVFVPFEISDTVNYDFKFTSVSKEFDNVQLMLLRCSFYNSYPSDVKARAVLLDVGYQEVYEFDTVQIRAAEITSNNRVESPAKTIHDFDIPKDYIERMNEVNHIVLYYTVYTKSNKATVLKYYEDYDIFLHVGVRVQYKLTP